MTLRLRTTPTGPLGSTCFETGRGRVWLFRGLTDSRVLPGTNRSAARRRTDYEPTCEAAMTAFAKSWRREYAE
jgi:hypothetical protein